VDAPLEAHDVRPRHGRPEVVALEEDPTRTQSPRRQDDGITRVRHATVRRPLAEELPRRRSALDALDPLPPRANAQAVQHPVARRIEARPGSAAWRAGGLTARLADVTAEALGSAGCRSQKRREEPRIVAAPRGREAPGEALQSILLVVKQGELEARKIRLVALEGAAHGHGLEACPRGP